jgi:hypothetical protein
MLREVNLGVHVRMKCHESHLDDSGQQVSSSRVRTTRILVRTSSSHVP